MTKGTRIAAAVLATGLAAAAVAVPEDAVPFKQLSSFQTFRLSVGSPGVEISPPSGGKYRQTLEFNDPARISPASGSVYMYANSKSMLRFGLGPDQSRTAFNHRWEFTCRVQKVSRLVVRRMNSGPADPSTIHTFETPVTNNVATFTVPNYGLSLNLIDVSTKPEYKTDANYFAWLFDSCDIRPVASPKVIIKLPPGKP